MMFSGLLCAALAAAQLAPLPADDGGPQQPASLPPISTDRPTESLSPGVVPRRTFQIEAGWKFSRSTSDGTRTDTHTAPDAVFRFGAFDRVELRLGASGWLFRTSSEPGAMIRGPSENGFSDMSAGLKASFVDERGRRPAISLFVDINVPLGNSGFTDDYSNPQVWLLFANSFSDKLGLTYNLGPQFTTLKQDGGSTRTVVDLEYVVTLSGAVTERASLFAEVFGSLPLSEGRQDSHTLQSGITALLINNMQVDARVGVGLVDNAPDWLIGLGFSIRLPR